MLGNAKEHRRPAAWLKKDEKREIGSYLPFFHAIKPLRTQRHRFRFFCGSAVSSNCSLFARKNIPICHVFRQSLVSARRKGYSWKIFAWRDINIVVMERYREW